MSRSLFFLLFSAILFVAACGKDDPSCASTALSDVIIGTFEVRALGSNTGDVEFRADGTLIDPSDALIGGEINGVVLDEKSYTLEGDAIIHARAANGSQFLEFDFPVTEVQCNEIGIEVFGIGATLRRK